MSLKDTKGLFELLTRRVLHQGVDAGGSLREPNLYQCSVDLFGNLLHSYSVRSYNNADAGNIYGLSALTPPPCARIFWPFTGRN